MGGEYLEKVRHSRAVCVFNLGAYANAALAYTWVEEFSFPAERLVNVPDNNGDHEVYIFTDGNGYRCLLFACHGYGNENDGYMATMGGKWYTNYAAAVDNEIRYHINRGEIQTNSFEKVYLLSCYSGYAPQRSVTMPVLKRTLQMVVYNRGVEGICEHFDNYGYVRSLTLLRDAGKKLPKGTKEFKPGPNDRIRVFKRAAE